MSPVAIGRFNHDIIRLFHLLRFFNNRLVRISHIAGENNLLRNPILRDPYLDTGRPKQMPHVVELYVYSFAQGNPLLVITGSQKLNGGVGIFHGIQRLKKLLPTSPSLPVPPLCLKLLNMGAVTEHNIAQV